MAIIVTDFLELRDAIDLAPIDGTPWVIFADADITMANAGANSASITISGGRNIILASYGTDLSTGTGGIRHTLFGPAGVSASEGPRHFIVSGEGSSLTLVNIILQGISTDISLRSGGVRVIENGNFVMENNTVIQGCLQQHGGAVRMNSFVGPGSTFTMNDGEITENASALSGGGVYMTGSGSIFNMNGIARIHNNSSGGSGGGVMVNTNGVFIINNGTIDNNISGSWGGGVRYHNGALFTMHTGRIANNTAGSGGGGAGGGSTSIFNMYAGIILNNIVTGTGGVEGSSFGGGGGVMADGTATFNMLGGEIAGNTADKGGGVFINHSARLNMSGSDTLITNNTSPRGGGVHVSRGTFFMNGGTITRNFADNSGGGIYLDIARLTFNGGEISDNGFDADGIVRTIYGGGVYVTLAGIFIATGLYSSSIVGNRVSRDGGGIFTEAFEYTRRLLPNAYYNLSTNERVVFADNYAGGGAFIPPVNPEITNIETPLIGPSIYWHPLNNYDINYRADILIGKEVDKSEVSVGETLTYTIRVENFSEVEITGISVSDQLDLSLVSFISGSVRVNDLPVPYSFVGGRLTIEIGSLAAGEFVIITFQVVVREAAIGGVITNTAILHIIGIPDDYSNVVEVEVGLPNIEIEKSADRSVVFVGERVTYTIRVDNFTATQVSGISISDELDLGLVNFVSNSVFVNDVSAAYSFVGGVLMVEIGSLAAGAAAVVTFQVEVISAAALNGEIMNAAVLHIPGLPNMASNIVVVMISKKENEDCKLIIITLLVCMFKIFNRCRSAKKDSCKPYCNHFLL